MAINFRLPKKAISSKFSIVIAAGVTNSAPVASGDSAPKLQKAQLL